MTQSRAAQLAAELDAILDTAQPGDDAVTLEIVRMASRRMHNAIERLQLEASPMGRVYKQIAEQMAPGMTVELVPTSLIPVKP